MRVQPKAVLTEATLLLASGFVALAGAQTTDHLKCYKIKDVGAFKSATADLSPLQPEFPSQNCSLKGKAAELCVPADKDNVVIVAGVVQNFPAQAVTDAQLCYKIKCPANTVAPLEVSDQFGTRNIEKFKASKVCGPAFEQ
jgi:hypothetical protein